MQFISILLALAGVGLIVWFGRRREKILKAGMQECADMARTYWAARDADDKLKIASVDSAIAGLAQVLEASKQREWGEAKKSATAAQRAEQHVRATQPHPAGAFGGDGVFYEAQPKTEDLVAMDGGWYSIQRRRWEDGRGNEVTPPLRHVTSGSQVPGPQVPRISPAMYGDWDEDTRRRRAVDSAMVDAQISGIGVVQVSSAGIEHVPASNFMGAGGSFDGGGASGDYDRGSSTASDSCSSSSASTSSDSSSSSCSSSDSGGGSSGSSD